MLRRGLVLVTILGLACGGRNEVAIEERTADTGTIRGVVRFVGDATQVGRLDVTQDTEVCGPSLRSPRLALGEGNGVGGAIVYLDGLDATPAVPSTPLSRRSRSIKGSASMFLTSWLSPWAPSSRL